MGKIKFHPFFVIYIFVCLYFGWLNNIFYYVVTVVLHEYGHYFMTRGLGYEVEGILFNVYGAGLKSNNVYKRRDDILISIAGPLVNVGLIIITVCFWWIIPTSYVFTLDFFRSNLVVLIFNILPIYPLDGGRIIMAILEGKINRKRLTKINTTICFGLGILFLVLFFVSLFMVVNFNLLFIGLFLAINGVVYDKNIYFEKIKAFSKVKNKPCEIKIFKVNSFDKNMLVKHISPRYFAVFVKEDKSGEIIYKEDEIFR